MLMNISNVKKKDTRMYTDKLKETLKYFTNKCDNNIDDGVFRNYGPVWARNQMASDISKLSGNGQKEDAFDKTCSEQESGEPA